MSLFDYKVLHIFGLLLLFSGLAALWSAQVSGGVITKKLRVGLSSLHGAGLLVLLVSGFGMLARLELMSALPLWAHIKIGIWIFMGASFALAKRKAHWGFPLVLIWVLAGTFAAYLCLYKPS